jgi:hypothetical protein
VAISINKRVFSDKKYPALIPEGDRAEAIPQIGKRFGNVVGSSDNIRNVALLSENVGQAERTKLPRVERTQNLPISDLC